MLFVAFHSISGVYSNVEYSNSDTKSSPPLIVQEVNHVIETVLIKTNDQVGSLGFLFIELHGSFIANIYFCDLSVNNSFYYRELPDYRKEIRRTKPHFFNGSKYKENNLII